MEQVEIKVAELDGRRIAFPSTTRFYVQVGRYKSAYKTRYAFTGDIHQAVRYYLAINIGNGYKKRLRLNDETLAVAYS